MADIETFQYFSEDFPNARIGASLVVQADCLNWLTRIPPESVHAVVTDPPYGVKEYELAQIEKREQGSGGIWRIPPSFDGHNRAPLPRFTALNRRERQALRTYFVAWSRLITQVLKPGGHVFTASNAFLSQLVFGAIVEGGLEFRGETIRLVRTLRGGDRPKNAETEFSDVTSMARGGYEPWGIFRKPLPAGMTVSECLRTYQTGGLRRLPDGRPFSDVIASERTPRQERLIADHPSLKPQAFLRQLVYVALPLGSGVILDPFMGSGSTIAAAQALGLTAVGIERHTPYFERATEVIPRLAGLNVRDEFMSVQPRLL